MGRTAREANWDGNEGIMKEYSEDKREVMVDGVSWDGRAGVWMWGTTLPFMSKDWELDGTVIALIPLPLRMWAVHNNMCTTKWSAEMQTDSARAQFLINLFFSWYKQFTTYFFTAWIVERYMDWIFFSQLTLKLRCTSVFIALFYLLESAFSRFSPSPSHHGICMLEYAFLHVSVSVHLCNSVMVFWHWKCLLRVVRL